MDLQLPCVFFLHPLNFVALNWPRTIALWSIGLLIWFALAMVVALCFGAYVQRRKSFTDRLKDKYGVSEEDEPWDETYGKEEDKDDDDKDGPTTLS